MLSSSIKNHSHPIGLAMPLQYVFRHSSSIWQRYVSSRMKDAHNILIETRLHANKNTFQPKTPHSPQEPEVKVREHQVTEFAFFCSLSTPKGKVVSREKEVVRCCATTKAPNHTLVGLCPTQLSFESLPFSSSPVLFITPSQSMFKIL